MRAPPPLGNEVVKYSPDANVLVKQIGEETALVRKGPDRVVHTAR